MRNWAERPDRYCLCRAEIHLHEVEFIDWRSFDTNVELIGSVVAESCGLYQSWTASGIEQHFHHSRDAWVTICHLRTGGIAGSIWTGHGPFRQFTPEHLSGNRIDPFIKSFAGTRRVGTVPPPWNTVGPHESFEAGAIRRNRIYVVARRGILPLHLVCTRSCVTHELLWYAAISLRIYKWEVHRRTYWRSILIFIPFVTTGR